MSTRLWPLIFTLCRHRALYKRNRHKCVVGQRLLRLFMMFVAVYQSSESLQAGSARKGAEGQAACRSCVAAAAAATPVLKTAVLNLTRPLFVGPVITMAVQNVVSWLLAVTAGLGLLWVGVTWAVPQLPLMPCQTCADSGNCQAIECGERCDCYNAYNASLLLYQPLRPMLSRLALKQTRMDMYCLCSIDSQAYFQCRGTCVLIMHMQLAHCCCLG